MLDDFLRDAETAAKQARELNESDEAAVRAWQRHLDGLVTKWRHIEQQVVAQLRAEKLGQLRKNLHWLETQIKMQKPDVAAAITHLDEVANAARADEPAKPERPIGPARFTVPNFVLDESTVRAGGFGWLYRATEKFPGGRPYAVKVLYPSAFVSTEHAATRFTTEVNTLRNLSHGAIVRYAIAGITDDEHAAPFLVMDYVEGETLRDLQPHMDVSQKVTAVVETLEVLGYLHGQGIFHRDVKPTNIMRRSSDQRIVLVDFGLVFVAAEAAGLPEDLTKSVVGTPGYIPREVVDDPKKSRSPKFDIYSAGVSLYELLEGRRPKVEEYRPLREIDPDLAGLDQIVETALQVESKRYSSAQAFARELQEWKTKYLARKASPPSPIVNALRSALMTKDSSDDARKKKQAEDEKAIKSRLRDADIVIADQITTALKELVPGLDGVRPLLFKDKPPLSKTAGLENICSLRSVDHGELIFARSNWPADPLRMKGLPKPVLEWPKRSTPPELASLCWILYLDYGPQFRGGIAAVVTPHQTDLFARPQVELGDPPRAIVVSELKNYATKVVATWLGILDYLQ